MACPGHPSTAEALYALGRIQQATGRPSEATPELGVCQWFHFEDHRLDDAVRWLRQMRVKYLRTGLSWSDYARPGREAWFDRQMQALDDFHVTVTFCFTPEHRGIAPHHTSAPLINEEFADFCAGMIERYADHLPVAPREAPIELRVVS